MNSATAKQDPASLAQSNVNPKKPPVRPGMIVLSRALDTNVSQLVIDAELEGAPDAKLQIEEWTFGDKPQASRSTRLEIPMPPQGKYTIAVRGRSGDTVYTTKSTLVIGPPSIELRQTPDDPKP